MEFNKCFILLVYGWVLYYGDIRIFYLYILCNFSVLYFIKVYLLLLVGLIEE